MRKIGKKRIKSYFESYGYFNADKGYVFTPMELAREMVKEMPASLFHSSVSTFLNGDCTASWTLMVAVVKRLKDNGHSDENIKSRIWGFCPSPYHIQLIKLYTGLTHIYCCNFLTINSWPDIYRSMKFDAIIGNPPYNGDVTGVKGGGRNNFIWDKFVLKSLEQLKPNGFLCLIHPAMWRKPEHELWPILTGNRIHFLKINSKPTTMKIFGGASTRSDWYILEKSSDPIKTKVFDEIGIEHLLDLRSIPFLPNYNFDEFFKICDGEDKCEIIYDTSHHGQKTKKTKDKYAVINNINSDGITFKYSSTNVKKTIGVPKVIVNDGWILYPINDFLGEYGQSEQVLGIKVSSNSEAESIVDAIKSEKFSKIVESTKWSNFRTDYRMFKYFRRDFWKDFV